MNTLRLLALTLVMVGFFAMSKGKTSFGFPTFCLGLFVGGTTI